jgi:hypothetical protein
MVSYDAHSRIYLQAAEHGITYLLIWSKDIQPFTMSFLSPEVCLISTHLKMSDHTIKFPINLVFKEK